MRLRPRRKVVDRPRVHEGLVDRQLKQIVEHLRKKPPTNRRAELKTGIDVTLDQQMCEPTCDHEVEAEELEAVGTLKTIQKILSGRAERLGYRLLDSGPDFSREAVRWIRRGSGKFIFSHLTRNLCVQILKTLHVALLELVVVGEQFLDRVIAEVGTHVFGVRVEARGRSSEVAAVVDEAFAPGGHEGEAADVKLSSAEEQRVFDVFLDEEALACSDVRYFRNFFFFVFRFRFGLEFRLWFCFLF